MIEDQYIVMAGNISEGYESYGPFVSFDEASEWADVNVEGNSWIATLHSPKETT